MTPVVSPLTSILAPFVGQNFLYQPAATNSPAGWREQTPRFSFTVDAATNIITVTGATMLREGMRVRLATLDYATGTLTSNNTNVSTGDTVTIGNKTYTFRTALTPTEGEILIGANADASLLNLIRAINHTGTPDTDYKCAAAHTQVTAATAVTAHAFAITSILRGTAYTTTEAAVTLSWAAAAMTGGVGTMPAPLMSAPWYYLRDVSSTAGTAKLVDSALGLINYPVLTISGGDETTEIITTTGAHGLTVGDRVNFPALTGGSGLTAASAFYYVETVPTTSTFTVSATLGGAAVNFTTAITAGTVQRSYVIDLTTTGTGTNLLQESALPLGLALDLVLGTVSGTPEAAGVYEITLQAFNAMGESADFIFPIGVRESESVLDPATGLSFDWDTGRVSLDDGTFSDDPAKPLFAIKNGDKLIFAVKFNKAGVAFRPVVQYLTAAIKVEDEEAAIVLTSGAVDVQGTGSEARFYFVMDTTPLADLVSGAISDASIDGPDLAKAWLELRAAFVSDPLRSGTSETFYKASRSIPVNVERSLIA